jgi:hypothetical protein
MVVESEKLEMLTAQSPDAHTLWPRRAAFRAARKMARAALVMEPPLTALVGMPDTVA